MWHEQYIILPEYMIMNTRQPNTDKEAHTILFGQQKACYYMRNIWLINYAQYVKLIRAQT